MINTKNTIITIIILVISISAGITYYSIKNKQIYNSPDDFTNMFLNNYELFFSIAKFAESSDGNLFVDVLTGDKLDEYFYFASNGSKQALEDKEIINKIFELFKKSKFLGISETDDSISFVLDSSDGFETGIIFLKSEGKLDSGGNNMHYELIKDKWYTYSIAHV